MKRIFCVLIGICVCHGFAVDMVRMNGYRYGAEAKERFHVVDQDGRPVVGAWFKGGFTIGENHMKDYTVVEGTTNTNGDFIAQGKCNDFLHYSIFKEGYYQSSGDVRYLASRREPCIVNGRWQPFGETHWIVLNRILAPNKLIPFRRNLRDLKIPVFEKWLGFDLEHGDWVKPWGRGVLSDVLMRSSVRVKNVYTDYDYLLEISFTNAPYAGAYLAQKNPCSELKTVHKADPNGVYESEFRFFVKALPQVGTMESLLKEDRYLVFRVRTEVDSAGHLKSAHYGVILGPWLFDQNGMTITDGCFNPLPNDLNVEDGRQLRAALKGTGRFSAR